MNHLFCRWSADDSFQTIFMRTTSRCILCSVDWLGVPSGGLRTPLWPRFCLLLVVGRNSLAKVFMTDTYRWIPCSFGWLGVSLGRSGLTLADIGLPLGCPWVPVLISGSGSSYKEYVAHKDTDEHYKARDGRLGMETAFSALMHNCYRLYEQGCLLAPNGRPHSGIQVK